jgi:NhaA family Na+:H+ antiporter
MKEAEREGRRRVLPSLGAVMRPLQQFFRLEAASSIVLFAAAVVALVWANSPAGGLHHALFGTPLVLPLGGHLFRVSGHQIINEGLMTMFFFLVGMEIKRELVEGELRTFKAALLPGVAALGGMVVPSALFLAFNAGSAGQAGWGIPMATDIAFALGCVGFLGRRVPHALVVFLTALAIFDDVGGILVIAGFYGHGIHGWWLLASGAVLGVLVLMNRARVRSGVAFAAAGVLLWFAVRGSGIHATIAGVMVGLLVPAGRQPSPLDRFIEIWHRPVAFGIMPLFALANSAVGVASMEPGALAGPVSAGTAVGLCLGKPLGIFAATALAIKTGLAQRPGGAGWGQIFGVSVVAGIGFTVALFIADLAYPGTPALLEQAKAGVISGSLLAGLAGFAILRFTRPAR